MGPLESQSSPLHLFCSVALRNSVAWDFFFLLGFPRSLTGVIRVDNGIYPRTGRPRFYYTKSNGLDTPGFLFFTIDGCKKTSNAAVLVYDFYRMGGRVGCSRVSRREVGGGGSDHVRIEECLAYCKGEKEKEITIKKRDQEHLPSRPIYS